MTAWRSAQGRAGGNGSIQEARYEEAGLLPDTHAHLDAADFAGDLESVVARAAAAGINRILTVGEDLATSRTAVQLAARYDIIFAAVGLHPHRAQQFHEERREIMRLLDREKVVALGEIGLDWVRGDAARPVQIEAFEEQLRWAGECGLPVSVHNRGTDEEVLTALDATRVTAVLHCFDSGWETARRALDAGHYVSFAGNLTYKRSDELREVARRVPADRMLLETDSPVLAPQRRRGTRNEPANVLETAEVLAHARCIPLHEACGQVSRNAQTVFGWSSL